MTREDVLALHDFVRIRIVSDDDKRATLVIYVAGETCLDAAAEILFFVLPRAAVSVDDLDTGASWFWCWAW